MRQSLLRAQHRAKLTRPFSSIAVRGLRRWRLVMSLVASASLLGAVGPVLSSAASPAASAYQVSEVPVGVAAYSVAANSDTNTIYAATVGGLDVIDGASNSFTEAVSTQFLVGAIAVDPSSNTVYAISGGSTVDTADVINGATNTVTSKISLPIEASYAGADPATHMVYVAQQGLGFIAVIDGLNNAVATFRLGNVAPNGIAVDAANDTIYIADARDDLVAAFDGKTNTVTDRYALPAGSHPGGVAVDSAAGLVYVADEGTGAISVIDTATHGVSTLASGMTQPTGLAFDSGSGTLYAVSPSGSADGLGTTYVIDASSGLIADQIPRGGSSVAVTGGSAYVAWSPGALLSDVSVMTPSPTTGMSPVIVNDLPLYPSFTVGQAVQDQMTANATPAATFSATGLPAGLSLSKSGLLSGTPANGTGGEYFPVVTAANGIAPPASSDVVIMSVDQAPAITSANAASFVVGAAGTFTMTASGFPGPTFSETGALPAGVSFTEDPLAGINGVLSGTPADGTAGSYPITITATNSAGSVTQAFTLIVTSASYRTVTVLPAAAGGGSSGGFAAWAVDSVGTLWYGTQTSAGSAWTWTVLGSGFQGTAAVEPVDAGGGSTGGFDLWIVDAYGNLWNAWQTAPGSAWQWAGLATGFQGSPVVVAADAGGLTSGGFAVLAVDSRGNLRTGWQPSQGSGWEWATLATGFQGTPAIVPADGGGLTSGGFAVMAVDTSGNLWTGWQTYAGSGWRWAILATGFQGTPTLVPVDAGGLASGGFAVLAVDTSGNLWTGWQTYAGSGWRWATLASGFQGTRQVTITPIDAGGSTTGGFTIMAIDSGGNLRNGLQAAPGSAWTWTTIDTGLRGTPVIQPVNAGGATTGGFDLWAIGTNGTLQNGRQTAPGSAWTWTSLGLAGS